MKLEKVLMTHEIIKNKEIPMNSIVLYLNNGVIYVCNKFNHSRKQELELLIWLPNEQRWIKYFTKNNYTELMWDYYRRHQSKNKNTMLYAQLMKHDRKYKKSRGGSSRSKNTVLTDYECRKEPLHDFRRCYN